jgi:hypothetical protein
MLNKITVAMPHESAYNKSSARETQMKAMEMRMKAKEAIAKVEEIMTLAYDGYGELMNPMERLRMINSVIYRYKKSLFEKESQDASS